MYLEAITVCVDYADFLAETLRFNLPFFDRWVIVTSKTDEETKDVCHQYNLPFIITDDFQRNGKDTPTGVFNKGRGIQRGLDNLECRDWILHIDADIVLPFEFRQVLEMLYPQKEKIYGADRMMVKGWDAWQRIKDSKYHQHGRHCYVLPHERYPIGPRWASPIHGYCPIGFFQLFHASAALYKGIWQRPYISHHSHAARSDVQFALQWDRQNREIIPELCVWHLESEHAPIGSNWAGRKTKRFQAPTPQPANLVATDPIPPTRIT